VLVFPILLKFRLFLDCPTLFSKWHSLILLHNWHYAKFARDSCMLLYFLIYECVFWLMPNLFKPMLVNIWSGVMCCYLCYCELISFVHFMSRYWYIYIYTHTHTHTHTLQVIYHFVNLLYDKFCFSIHKRTFLVSLSLTFIFMILVWLWALFPQLRLWKYIDSSFIHFLNGKKKKFWLTCWSLWLAWLVIKLT